MNKNILATMLVIMMFPFGAYAGAADSIGNGISDVVGGVGDAVTDVGKGVGDGVSDIGNGIGNAFSSTPTSKVVSTSDTAINSEANNNIKVLLADGKIQSGYDLKITTVDGVVIISGHVSAAEDINTIVSSINDITGVKSVNTQNIVVK